MGKLAYDDDDDWCTLVAVGWRRQETNRPPIHRSAGCLNHPIWENRQSLAAAELHPRPPGAAIFPMCQRDEY